MSYLFAGGEDGDFIYTSGGVGAGVLIDTNTAHFRNTYARYGLGTGVPILTAMFAATSGNFWFSSRVWNDSDYETSADMVYFSDSTGVKRLSIKTIGNGAIGNGFQLVKYDASGTATVLGTCTGNFSVAPATPDKLDIQVNYAVSGSVNVYINLTNVLSYTGDVTTNSITALGSVSMTGHCSDPGSNNSVYSEVMVATADTRSKSLCTFGVPSAAGAVDQWTGLFSDINGNSPNQSSPNYTLSAGQTQEYAVNGPIPTGSLGVDAVILSAQAVKDSASAAGSLAQILRLGTTDYSAATRAVGTSWQTYQDFFGPSETNVVTINLSDLAGSNIGFSSAT